MRFHFNAPLTHGFALVSVAVMALSQLSGGASTQYLFSVYAPQSPWDLLTLIRIVTHVLGHSSWDHLWANVSILVLLGPLLEERYGTRPLFYMMLTTAVLTGLAHIIVSVLPSSVQPPSHLLGASGIVFMCMFLASVSTIRAGEIQMSFLVVILMYVLREGVVSASTDGVSHLTHLIGGVCGAAFGFIIANAQPVHQMAEHQRTSTS